jgi:3-hydroxyisobutyrate dehydrogenase
MNELMSKPRVAILGLGNMGYGMASRLLSEKFPLIVYNRSAHKSKLLAVEGAAVASSPREAASNAEIIFSIVADDGASKSVWLGEDGALAGTTRASVLVECSTLTVAWVLELAAIAAQQGFEFLDAPVTGSKPQAATGQLLFLAGGTASAVEKAKPVLAVLGRDVIHLGPSGSGARLKLINNFLCGVQAASYAEAVSMISAGGLDAEKAMSILTNGAPGSPLIKTISARAAARDAMVNFSLGLMAKDLSYALEEAKRNHIPLETVAAALGIFKRAIDNGLGENDFSAVIASLQQK